MNKVWSILFLSLVAFLVVFFGLKNLNRNGFRFEEIRSDEHNKLQHERNDVSLDSIGSDVGEREERIVTIDEKDKESTYKEAKHRVTPISAKKLVLLNDVKLLSEETYEQLKEMGVQEFLRLFTLLIDKEQDGYFDSLSVEKRVKKFFPNRESVGYCVIDWERKAFQRLKSGRNSKDFKVAEEQYISLIKFIKEMRPNIKIGVYGMPFRQNTIRNPRSHYGDFTTEAIISAADFVAPSLYLLYRDAEVGLEKNKEYIRINMERALRMANGKPVIPYVGYRIYSVHSKDSWQYIPLDDFEYYIDYMKEVNYNGSSLQGFVMWNGDYVDNRSNQQSEKRNSTSRLPFSDFEKEYNEKVIEYFSVLVK